MEQKKDWLNVITEGKRQGIPQRQVCRWAGLSPRRVQRWKRRASKGACLEDRRPGPDLAPHRLLEEEKRTMISFACSDDQVDASPRVVAYRALDQNVVAMSPTSAYRTLEAEGLMADRSTSARRRPGSASIPPPRPELTGPNQRWCWDITYLRTQEKWKFLFLYVMLDEWSRKAVGWLVATAESAAHAKELTDQALEKEGLLLAEKAVLPTVHSDRGSPMKARSFKRFLEELGLSQVLSRPRTPNDNPFVEAFFRTAKYAPAYPGYFSSQQEAIEYFRIFFRWYNEEHLHSGIQYVPPALKHAGVADRIVNVRQERLAEARSRRLQMNCGASETGVTGVPLMGSGL